MEMGRRKRESGADTGDPGSLLGTGSGGRGPGSWEAPEASPAQEGLEWKEGRKEGKEGGEGPASTWGRREAQERRESGLREGGRSCRDQHTRT